MGIEVEEELYALRADVRNAEAKAGVQKAARDLVIAQRDAERRREHTAKLKGIAIAAINAKLVAPSTLTHFTTRFGADNSDAIMRATSADVIEWLGTSAPRDKTMRATVMTRASAGDAVDAPALSNSDSYAAACDRKADEFDIAPAQRFSADNIHRIAQAVQESDPELVRAHVRAPAGS
jgi:hypothetical protein